MKEREEFKKFTAGLFEFALLGLVLIYALICLVMLIISFKGW